MNTEEKTQLTEKNALSEKDHDLTQVMAMSEYARLNLQRAETERERMQIIIKSGKATTNRFIDNGSHRPFYLPVVGKYVFSHKENRRTSEREALDLAKCIRQLIAIKLDLLNQQ